MTTTPSDVKKSYESKGDMLTKAEVMRQIRLYKKASAKCNDSHLRLVLAMYTNAWVFVCQNKVKDFDEFMEHLKNYKPCQKKKGRSKK